MWPRLPSPRVRAAPTERGVAIPRLSSALRVRGRGGRAPPTGSSGRRTLPLTPWSRVAEGMRELPAAQPGPAHPRPHEMRAGAGVGVHHPMSGCLLEWGGRLPCVRGCSPSGASGPGGAAGGERAGGCGGAAGGLSALLGMGSRSRRAPSGTPREGCGGRDMHGAGSGVHTHQRGSGQVHVQVAQGHAPTWPECANPCMGHTQACA